MIVITVAAVIADFAVDRDQQMPPVTTRMAAKITSMRNFADDSWITLNTIKTSIAHATNAIMGTRRWPPCRTSISDAIKAQTTTALAKSMVIEELPAAGSREPPCDPRSSHHYRGLPNRRDGGRIAWRHETSSLHEASS